MILRIWKTLCLVSSLTASACAHGERNLQGKLWQGEPEHEEIWRSQDARAIRCAEPAFGEYTCLKTKDLVEHDKACKEWK